MQTLKTRFAALTALALAVAFCAPAPAQTYRENNPVIGKELSDTHFDKGVAEAGKFTLKPATTTVTGAVKPDGTTTSVNASGALSVNAAGIASSLPLATTSVKGVVTLATAGEAPSTSDQEAATPAFVNAAIAASTPNAQNTANAIAADATAQATLAGALKDDLAGDTAFQSSLKSNLGATAAETIAGTEAGKFVSPDDLKAALQSGAAYPVKVAADILASDEMYPGSGNTFTGAMLEYNGTVFGSRTNNISGSFNRNTDGAAVALLKSGVVVGNIAVTGTGVTYNSNSDYRLKTVTGPLTTSGAFIDALQPKVGEWKAKPGEKAAFFIAHEVQAVSPSSVTGTKDAVDKDGKPVMQSMAYGSAEMIVNIVAELQSLRKRVAANDAEISSLKARQK